MKDQYQNDLNTIKEIMEKSTRFVSLSGLSGILAGIYATIGALAAYYIVYYSKSIPYASFQLGISSSEIILLLIIASIVFFLTIGTAIILSNRKATKLKAKLWDTTGKQLTEHLFIPVLFGGLFIVLLYYHAAYTLIAPASLIFYGLGLINASKYTVRDIKLLGITEAILGVTCGLFPGYGLLFWFVGFGVMHVVYGTIMYLKYDK